MGSEIHRIEMIRFLKLQQAFPERSVHLRQQNWNAYVIERELYLKHRSDEQGTAYEPIPRAFSGAELHTLERQTGRLN